VLGPWSPPFIVVHASRVDDSTSLELTATAFRALGDPTRLRVVNLRAGDQPASWRASPVGRTHPRVAGLGGAVPGEPAVLDVVARRRHRGRPAFEGGRLGAVLRLRHHQDPAAARRHHLRRHDPAQLHECRTDPCAAGRAPRRSRQCRRRGSGRRDPVLFMQCSAGVHRVRGRRRSSRRHPQLPHRLTARERGRRGDALRAVRLADRSALHGCGARDRHGAGHILGRLQLEAWVEPFVFETRLHGTYVAVVATSIVAIGYLFNLIP
jgi:hypothetical protein